MKLDRRNALLGLAGAGAALSVLAMPARAQTQPAASAGLEAYVQQTLLAGTVSLKTSEIAAQKATDANVKRFADLEVAEQQTIASVLASTPAGQTPPQLPPERQKMIDDLNAMQAGEAFDQAYIQAQIEGHNELLTIQQTTSGGSEATVEAITARLAEQAVASHIAMLNLIQQMIGAESIQNIQEGQNPDGSTAPAGGAPAEGTPADGGQSGEQAVPAGNGG